MEEKTISTKLIYSGRILSLREDTVLLPTGREGKREIVSHPGAVAVIAETEKGFVLVRQYRKPVEEALWELPAGKLDPGEEPQKTALRELAEETGYKAGKLVPMGMLYLSPGFSDERMYLFAAEELEEGKAHPDGDEHLQVGFSPGRNSKGCFWRGRSGMPRLWRAFCSTLPNPSSEGIFFLGRT